MRIAEHRRPPRHHRLPAIHGRHFPATCRESPLHGVDDRGILLERQREMRRDHFAGEIVVGWPETAGQDEDAVTRKRVGYVCRQFGAVVTDDPALVEMLKSLRVHGQGADKYDNVRIGMTSRLDTIQAAILIEKLKIFADEIDARDRVAQRYAAGLEDVSIVPVVPDGYTSIWAQYTIRLKPGIRDGLAAALKAQGIPTAIYYPKPLHRLEAYRSFPVVDNGIPVTEQLAEEVISLPMHAYLDAPTQDRVIEAVRAALKP